MLHQHVNEEAKSAPYIEKRSFDRLSCLLEAYDGKRRRIGLINDVSLNGFRIDSDHKFELQKSYSVNVQFPNQEKPNIYTGRVLYSLPHEDGKSFYGFHIEEASRQAKKSLEKFILARRAATQTEDLINSFKELKTKSRCIPHTDLRVITTVFDRCAKDKIPFKFTLEGLYLPIEAKLVEIRQSTLLFRLKSKDMPYLEAAKCLALMLIDYQSYFFESSRGKLEGNLLTINFPTEVFYSEKRVSDRVSVKDSSKQMKIHTPIPQLGTFSFPIVDYSPRGVAFRFDTQALPPLPGTVLSKVEVPLPKHRITSAIVRHIGSIEGSPNSYKIGIQCDQENVTNLNHKSVSLHSLYPKKKNWIKSLLEKAYQTSSYLIQSQSEKLKPKIDEKVFKVRFQNDLGQEVVGILDSTLDLTKKQKTPVVIILPAWVKRKETFSPLAMTIVDNFRRSYRDITTIRFDLTNHIGESYKEEGSRESGRECIKHAASHVLKDIRATLKFVKKNPYFIATDIIMISFSYLSPFARRVICEDSGRNIKYWVSAMGASDLQTGVRTVGGGIDYISNYKRGVRHGNVSFFGTTIDMDHYCEDLLKLNMDSLDDAKEDMKHIQIPICAIYGKYDAWIDYQKVREVVQAYSSDNREMIELPCGHLPTSSDQAFFNFRLITEKIFNFLHHVPLETKNPPINLILKKEKIERKLLTLHHIENREKYWDSYLLGSKEDSLGYDILIHSLDYTGFLDDQLRSLSISDQDVFLDIGAGTGLFERNLLLKAKSASQTLPKEIFILDLSERALQRAKQNHAFCATTNIVYQSLDLALSPLLPIKRFINGELHNLKQLIGRVPGLEEEIVAEWEAVYSDDFHRYLRADPGDVSAVEDIFKLFKDPYSQIIAKQFHEAAKVIRQTSDVNNSPFEIMQAFGPPLPEKLDIPSNTCDKLLCSLVLSYLSQPEEIMREFYRVLKPGGKLVISSPKLDSDFSIIYKNMVMSIENDKSLPSEELSRLREAARDFMNAAALLWHYQSEGLFRFFGKEELYNMTKAPGFYNISSYESYGTPTQVLVLVATK